MATVDSANTLSEFVDALQSRGRYTFTRDEAKRKTGQSEEGIKKSITRLKKKGRIASPKKGFFVIVPLEYQSSGCPPASWFIDDVMEYLDHPYYVGILTAAEIHGAAHQRPQIFQVVTDDVIKPIQVEGIGVQFFKKKDIEDTLREEKKSYTGYFDISTPEATTFDLMYFRKLAGGINNIATVLSELASKLEPEELLKAAKTVQSRATIQRTGYILDWLGEEELTTPLSSWLSDQDPVRIPLNPSLERKGAERVKKWEVLVNTDIDPDV